MSIKMIKAYLIAWDWEISFYPNDPLIYISYSHGLRGNSEEHGIRRSKIAIPLKSFELSEITFCENSCKILMESIVYSK